MAHITVRIPDNEKRALEELARILKTTSSDLLRRFILQMTKIASTLEAMEIVNNLEKKIIDMLVTQKEFQEMLAKLNNYMICENIGSGWDRQDPHEVCYIASDGDRYATIIVDDKLFPAFVIDVGFDSSDGNHHYYDWETIEVQTLEELAEWLELVADVVDTALRDKLDSLRRSLCTVP